MRKVFIILQKNTKNLYNNCYLLIVKESGIIINTFPWTKGEGYKNLKHIAEAFEVNIIFVLDNERLYHELMRDMPLFVRIVYLPRSGGVVSKTKSQRNEARDLRIKDYFYGSKFKLYPFSFEMKFSEMKLFRIGAPSLPASCMPIGIKVRKNIFIFSFKPQSPESLYFY